MGIYEQVMDVCKGRVGNIFSTSEILDLVVKEYGTNRKSIIPSDYCYNRINEGIDFTKHIFVHDDTGKYEFIGENSPYFGKIYFKPKGGTERVVGKWNDGNFYLWENFTKVSSEHYRPELNPNGNARDIALAADIQEIGNRAIPDTEKTQLIAARVGQGDFRNSLLDYWGKCVVTGAGNIKMLLASHIKPWSKSDDIERLDKFNGLLLSPNLDRAFDQGLISFDSSGKILISRDFKTPEIYGIDKNMKINIEDEHRKYLAFHRQHVFKNT